MLIQDDLNYKYIRVVFNTNNNSSFAYGANENILETYTHCHNREEFMNLLYSQWLESIL